MDRSSSLPVLGAVGLFPPLECEIHLQSGLSAAGVAGRTCSLLSPGTVTTPLAAQGLHPLLSRAEGRRCGSAAPGGGQLHLDPSRSGDQRQDGAGLVKSWGWVAEAEEMEHRVPGQRGAESIRTRLIQRVGCALRCVPTCPSLCSAAGSPDNCFPAEPSQ